MTPRVRGLATGSAFIAMGLGGSAFGIGEWYLDQLAIGYSGGAGGTLVLYFYAGLLLSIVVILLGGYLVCRASAVGLVPGGPPTTASLVASSVASKRLLGVGAMAAALYGVLYAFASSVLVYQPTVDFATAYGVGQPGWSYLAAYGPPGSVPKLVLYIAPSQHLAVQLVPLSLLLLFIVPPLVGLNLMVSYQALARTLARTRGRLLVTSAAVTGLFTACPTCAGVFLAGSLGGIGVVAAAALAPYQLLFILFSLPVLLLSPALTAASARRSFESCPIPT